MTIFKIGALAVPMALLSGCGFFESLFDRWDEIVDETTGRPYFAYTLSSESNTDILLATLTEDRKGLLRKAVKTGFESGSVTARGFSPSQTYLSVSYLEFSGSEFDTGTIIVDVAAAEIVASTSDTVMDGYMQRSCRETLEAAAQVIVDEDGVRLGRNLELRSLEYQESRDAGFIYPQFWVNNRHLVARYSLPYDIMWIDRDNGETDVLDADLEGNRPITGLIDLRRGADGTWQLRGCGATATPRPEPAETAELRVGERGKLMLDGVELDNALLRPGNPMETRGVGAVTRWTFPF